MVKAFCDRCDKAGEPMKMIRVDIRPRYSPRNVGGIGRCYDASSDTSYTEICDGCLKELMAFLNFPPVEVPAKPEVDAVTERTVLSGLSGGWPVNA